MIRHLIVPACMLSAGLLAGCAPGSSAGTAPVTSGAAPTSTAGSLATSVKSFYADFEIDAALWVTTHPQDAAGVAKIEGQVGPEIAALSNDAPLTSVSNVVADISSDLAALPPGVVSTKTQGVIDMVTLGLQMASVFIPSPATTAPVQSPAAPAPATVPATAPAASGSPPPGPAPSPTTAPAS